MAAVWYRFRAEFRTRWRSVFALALLAGIAGSATLAAIAGARRTDSAYSRLLVDTNAAHVLVNPDSGNDSHLDPKSVARLPMVSEAGREQGVIVIPSSIRSPQELDNLLGLASDGKSGYSIARLRVLDGRAPDAQRVDEVLVNPLFARQHGLSVGDHLDAAVISGDDFAAFDAAGLSFPQALAAVKRGDYGTLVRLKIVGIGVAPEEIVVDEGFATSNVFLTPTFLRRYPQADAGFFGLHVRLRHGAADIAAFKQAVQALPHKGAIEFQTTPVTEVKVARAVRPQVGALTVFAIVIAITGLLLVGQALARQTFLDSVDHPTLRALGFGRSQLVVTSMLRAAVVALGAAVLAMVVAVAASPLTPIGVARTAEPDLGVFVDGPMLALGALTIVTAVLALAAIPAWWHTRAIRFRSVDQPSARPSRLVGWLRVSGASLPAVVLRSE